MDARHLILKKGCYLKKYNVFVCIAKQIFASSMLSSDENADIYNGVMFSVGNKEIPMHVLD